MSRQKLVSLSGSLLLALSLLVGASAFVPSAYAAPKTTQTAAVAAASSVCPPTQSNGSSGTWVKVIQYRLNTFYHYYSSIFSGAAMPLSVDGGFGSHTQAAVVKFQSAMSIGNNGVVGTDTWRELGFCNPQGASTLEPFAGKPFTTACPPTISQGASGTWVQALQYRLNGLHQYDSYLFPDSPQNHFYYPLATDGGFGAQTDSTVRAFQYDVQYVISGNVVGIDGIVAQRTWAALGLC